MAASDLMQWSHKYPAQTRLLSGGLSRNCWTEDEGNGSADGRDGAMDRITIPESGKLS